MINQDASPLRMETIFLFRTGTADAPAILLIVDQRTGESWFFVSSSERKGDIPRPTPQRDNRLVDISSLDIVHKINFSEAIEEAVDRLIAAIPDTSEDLSDSQSESPEPLSWPPDEFPPDSTR
jgi:hypothetical protein